jgi:ATP/maltotriose-dependent transcriptional regulator MalT
VKTAGYTERCAEALNQIAGIEANQGSFGEAEQHYATAVDYYKRVGSIRGHAGVKMNLAVMNQMRSRGDEVWKNYSEALVLGERSNDENIISGSLYGLAFYHLESGDTDKAESFLVRAAETAEKSGNKPLLIRVIYGFAVLDNIRGDHKRAASTAITLLHEPAADAEAGSLCTELLQKIRRVLGNSAVDKLGRENLTLSELMDIYMRRRGTDNVTVYRKGEK